MRSILSVRPKCSHRCASLKETPLKPVQILKHTTNNSAEQTAMRTKWFKHIAIKIVQALLLECHKRFRCGIYLCPFILSWPINNTYEEQSQKGPRHNLHLSRKKWETPPVWKPPRLSFSQTNFSAHSSANFRANFSVLFLQGFGPPSHPKFAPRLSGFLQPPWFPNKPCLVSPSLSV